MRSRFALVSQVTPLDAGAAEDGPALRSTSLPEATFVAGQAINVNGGVVM